MKKIGIDFSPIEDNPAGIGQYTLSLFSELFKLDATDKFIIYSTKPVTLTFPDNVINVVIKWPVRFKIKGVRWMRSVAKDCTKKNLNLFISPSNLLFSLLFPKTIQFIHDIAPISFSSFFNLSTRFSFPVMVGLAMEKAYRIVTLSEQIKQELLNTRKINPDKITVIYPSINQNILNDPQIFTGFDLNCDYVLSISTLEPRKNYQGSLKLFANLIKNPKFAHYKYLIVGKKGWYYDKIFKTVKKLNIEEKVIFLGYVADEFIADIIKKSKCLLYLSYYEGFGIPPIEALYFNIPVLVNDIPVFREIYGEFADYIDCKDIDRNLNKYTTELIEVINEKPKNSKDQIFQKYNNKNSALKFLNLIQK